MVERRADVTPGPGKPVLARRADAVRTDPVRADPVRTVRVRVCAGRVIPGYVIPGRAAIRGAAIRRAAARRAPVGGVIGGQALAPWAVRAGLAVILVPQRQPPLAGPWLRSPPPP